MKEKKKEQSKGRSLKELDALYDAVLILRELGMEPVEIQKAMLSSQGKSLLSISQIRDVLRIAGGSLREKERESSRWDDIKDSITVHYKAHIDSTKYRPNRRQLAIEALYGTLAEELKELPSIKDDNVPEIVVVNAPHVQSSEHESPEDWISAVKTFASSAAPLIQKELISDYCSGTRRTIGIAWGRTLLNTVGEILNLDLEEVYNDLRFFPVWPDPCGALPERPYADEAALDAGEKQYVETASRLSVRLDRHFRKSISKTFSLKGIPGILPNLPEPQREAFRNIISEINWYSEIFGDHEDSLINSCDGVLVAMGSSSNYRDGHLSEFWNTEHMGGESFIDSKFLELEVVGDVGGCLFPKPGFEKLKGSQKKKLEKYWIGIKEDHLINISKDSQLGVIALACGPDRAGSVMNVLRQKDKVIRKLICCSNCARELRRLISIENQLPDKDSTEYRDLELRTLKVYQGWENDMGVKVVKKVTKEMILHVLGSGHLESVPTEV